MKINTTFHVLVLFMAGLIFSMPFVTIAQEDSWKLEARVAAERDAEADSKQLLWVGGTFLLGVVGNCVLGSVGLLGAVLYEPTPSASRLLGKSPEYVLVYADAYHAKTRQIQVRSAVLGCIGGVVVSTCIWAPRLVD